MIYLKYPKGTPYSGDLDARRLPFVDEPDGHGLAHHPLRSINILIPHSSMTVGLTDYYCPADGYTYTMSPPPDTTSRSLNRTHPVPPTPEQAMLQAQSTGSWSTGWGFDLSLFLLPFFALHCLGLGRAGKFIIGGPYQCEGSDRLLGYWYWYYQTVRYGVDA